MVYEQITFLQETREPEPEPETVVHMNRNRYEPEPVWTGTGLWKLTYAQNGCFWRNNDFFMIFHDFSMPKNRKMTKKIKIEKKKVEKS